MARMLFNYARSLPWCDGASRRVLEIRTEFLLRESHGSSRAGDGKRFDERQERPPEVMEIPWMWRDVSDSFPEAWKQ